MIEDMDVIQPLIRFGAPCPTCGKLIDDEEADLPNHKPDCTPWRTRFERHPSGETTYRLVERGASRRSVICPTTEGQAVGNALAGREYPLLPAYIDLVRGLPVIDLGSHCGGTAVYWEEMLQPSQLHCYEPSVTAYDYLDQNVGADTAIHCCAVGGANGTSNYFQRAQIYSSGLYDNGLPSKKPETVELTSGADVINKIRGEIGVLKIDIEGAELAVLESMQRELDRVRIVFIEYHNESTRRVIDQYLRGFSLFYSNAMDFVWWGQGTIGYINNRYLDALRSSILAHRAKESA